MSKVKRKCLFQSQDFRSPLIPGLSCTLQSQQHPRRRSIMFIDHYTHYIMISFKKNLHIKWYMCFIRMEPNSIHVHLTLLYLYRLIQPQLQVTVHCQVHLTTHAHKAPESTPHQLLIGINYQSMHSPNTYPSANYHIGTQINR